MFSIGAIGALMNRVLQPRLLVVLGLNVWVLGLGLGGLGFGVQGSGFGV